MTVQIDTVPLPTAPVSPGRVDRIVLLRWLVGAGLAAVFFVLLLHFSSLLSYIRFALNYPFQLDYGEGIVWQQARNIWAGEGYAPLRTFPAIVYHYPPIYHLTFEALAALTGIDEMLAGRLVSIISSGLTAIIVALLTGRIIGDEADGRTRAICGAFAGLVFLACFPVRMWVPVMRVDMLSVLFGMAGLWFAWRALSRPNLIYIASGMFVLGMFVKQISVAPPAAAFLVLLFTHRALALRGLAAALAMGLAGLGIEQWLNGGEFLQHIVGYNVNRLDTELLWIVLVPQLKMHAAIIVLGLLGAISASAYVRHVMAGADSLVFARRRIADDPKAILILMLILFVAMKTVMLSAMMKSGASYNYMIDWFVGIAIFAGVAIAPCVALGLGKGVPIWRPALYATFFIILPAQLVAMLGLYADQPSTGKIDQLLSVKQPIVEMIAASDRPVIADDMTFPIRAGRKVLWESAITAELGAKGVYDQDGFARLVRARCLGFFAVEGILGQGASFSRYNPVVIAAIVEAYPRTRPLGNYMLYFPDAPADPHLCASVR